MYSVIIPIHNEEDSVETLYHSIREVMSTLDSPWEIIFVDDGSTDSGLGRLKSIYARADDLTVVVLKERAGKSEALQAGFDNARGDIYITLDGDGQDDPGDIPVLLNKMDEGYDVVFGWRHLRRDPFLKTCASKIANGVRRVMASEKIHDVGCNMRVFRKECVKGVRLSGGLHRFFSLLMIKQGYRVAEAKISHLPRKAGVSKYGIGGRAIEGVMDFLRISFLGMENLRKHPSRYRIKEILKGKIA